MPYSNVSELPDAVKNNLPPTAQRQWMHVFNSSLAGRCKGDDGCAAEAAWGVINNHYHKNKDGKWVANKSEIVEFSLAITKASFDPKTQERRFVATASDTDQDSYGEAMSLELFNDFIDRAKKKERPPEHFCSVFWAGGMPYLSVAHYFDLDGKGAVGEVSDIYIDGKQLKAKGKFLNTPLGIAAYEAVKKSINQKADAIDDTQKKIRISIAFLDYGHQHGTNPPYFRKNGTNVRCPYCAKGENDVKYLRGHLIHLALTRVPVNTRTDIIGGEVERSMGSIQTRKDDAASIVGEELAEELEKESVLVGKSETEELVIKAEEEEVVEEAVEEVTAEPEDEENIDVREEDDPEVDDEEEEPVEDAISKRPDVNPKEGKKKYGDVAFADAKNKKYPIDTEEHIRAAWNYINKPKNAGKYSSSEVATIKRKIIAAWKKKIDPAGPPSASKKSETEEVALPDPIDTILNELSIIKQEISEMKPVLPAEAQKLADQGMKVELEEPYPELRASFDNFMKFFSESVDNGLQGDALLQQVQAPFEQFGTTVKEVAASLSKVEPESTDKSAVGLEDLLRKVVAEAVQPLQNEIALVKSQVSAVTQARVVQDSAPVQPIRPTPRGITGATIQSNPVVLQSLQNQSKARDPNKPLSLREIAERSAYAK